jgi:hypothetical protein
MNEAHILYADTVAHAHELVRRAHNASITPRHASHILPEQGYWVEGGWVTHIPLDENAEQLLGEWLERLPTNVQYVHVVNDTLGVLRAEGVRYFPSTDEGKVQAVALAKAEGIKYIYDSGANVLHFL